MTEPLPLTFREIEVDQIMQALVGGDSCAIVGIGSVGKSNLLQFLQREDVRQAKLGDDWAQYLPIYVDTNKLLKSSLWGALELMLHQLLLALADRQVDDELLRMVDDLHRRATHPETQQLTLRYLERAMGLACNRLGFRLVFLFDEADDLVRRLPTKAFASLRALRDQFKYQVMYIVTSRLPLERLRPERREIEPFEELMTRTIWLGPYSEADTRLMWRRLSLRHGSDPDQSLSKAMLEASGGHSGLLREIFIADQNHPRLNVDRLATEPNIRDECFRIWSCFTDGERQMIVSLADGSFTGSANDADLEQLRRKRVVKGEGEAAHLFSPLFATYVRQSQPQVGGAIQVDRRRRIVWVNGQEIKRLTPLEYDLMDYLEKKRGQACSRDELIEHLYPDELVEQGITDNRLDSVVKRLRKRVEPNPKKPRYIATVRGHGFRLEDGGS